MIIDNTDYPFVLDTALVGEWRFADFVEEIEQFNVDFTRWKGNIYLKGIRFIDGGIVEADTTGEYTLSSLTWSNGVILNKIDGTCSAYQILEMGGSQYIFFEWKSGDYQYRGLRPRYYVMKKVS